MSILKEVKEFQKRDRAKRKAGRVKLHDPIMDNLAPRLQRSFETMMSNEAKFGFRCATLRIANFFADTNGKYGWNFDWREFHKAVYGLK